MTDEGLTLREILQAAEKTGQLRHERRVRNAREKMFQIREKIKAGWRTVKEGGQAVGKGMLTAEALIADPKIRGELRKWAQERISQEWESFETRCKEIGVKIGDKAEFLIDGARSGLRKIRDSVSGRMKPVVDGAKKVGSAVVYGVETAGLFVVSLPVEVAMGAYRLGEKGVEAGKQAFEAGKRKARE